MKSIIDYINENLQFINESFECDVLKRADSSIKNCKKNRMITIRKCMETQHMFVSFKV